MFPRSMDMLFIKDLAVCHSVATNRLSCALNDPVLIKMFQGFHSLRKPSFKDALLHAHKPTNDSGLNSDIIPENAEDDQMMAKSITNKKVASRIPIFNGSKMEVKEIVSEIESNLPPANEIQLLLNHFFKNIYVMLPYLDEKSFRNEIKSSKGSYFTQVLLLIILRISYISKGDDRGKNYIALARNLLWASCGGLLFQDITLPKIQCLLYLCLYQTIAPEVNNESTEFSISVSILCQMCKLIGMNRDPAIFPHQINDERVCFLWRKIFNEVCFLDALNSFNFGTTIIFPNDQYDTLIPNGEEEQICQDMKIRHRFVSMLSPMMGSLLGIANTVSMKKLKEFLNQLEEFNTIYLKSECLHPMLMDLFTLSLMMIKSFSYIIFLNDPSNDIAARATTSSLRLFQICTEFAIAIDGREETDYKWIVPFLFTRMQLRFERCIFWIMSASIRSMDQLTIVDDVSVKEWFQCDSNTIPLIAVLNRFKDYLTMMKNLSDRFFICWRNKVMTEILFAFIRRLDKSLYDNIFDDTWNMDIDDTLLEELDGMFNNDPFQGILW